MQIILRGKLGAYAVVHKEDVMLVCPLCDQELSTRTSAGWMCRCGELIPVGMEEDDDENCENCPIRDCPRRK